MIDLFWVYLACFLIVITGLPANEWCEKRKLRKLATFILSALLIASAVLFIKGAFMASGWSNPFAGKFDELSRVVHRPNEWLAVGILSVLPYFLMGLSGLSAFASAGLLIKRHYEISN